MYFFFYKKLVSFIFSFFHYFPIFSLYIAFSSLIQFIFFVVFLIMDLEPNVRRVISNLSNISINTHNSFLIFEKYCIINKRVLVKKTEGLKEIWVDSDEDYLKIIKLAGFDFKKKNNKKKVDYLKAIETDFQKFKNHEEISISNKLVKIPENNKETKSLIVEFYNHCFVSGGEKLLLTFYDLGILCNAFGEDFCIEIQKNLKGSLRFKAFADRLPTGVYQLVKIPVTYFIKITNQSWNDFLLGRKAEATTFPIPIPMSTST
ncbi:MAG: hypothetical protein DMG62_00075 [Acidobacteria bacterium]|nr:MAG: hypothetical protein DMG62_00075 [Acidobacteriota bacterium]